MNVIRSERTITNNAANSLLPVRSVETVNGRLRPALTMDDSGNLYGTTLCNGSYGWGSVFKLTNTQNGWEYTSLHDFTGFSDGRFPWSNVTIDTDGTLYGTASKGGSSSCNPQYQCGTVWMIKP